MTGYLTPGLGAGAAGPATAGAKLEQSPSIRAPKHRLQWYGWDSRAEIWHGPNEISPAGRLSRKLLNELQDATGRSWYGPVNCCLPGEPEARFFAIVHDLSDCAIAMIYCDESKAGPAEILAVIPAQQRAVLRPDFAFEFLAFAGFLGALGAGAQLRVNDAIVAGIAETDPADTLVFSVSSGMWPDDLDHLLSRSVEEVVVTLERWLRR